MGLGFGHGGSHSFLDLAIQFPLLYVFVSTDADKQRARKAANGSSLRNAREGRWKISGCMCVCMQMGYHYSPGREGKGRGRRETSNKHLLFTHPHSSSPLPVLPPRHLHQTTPSHRTSPPTQNQGQSLCRSVYLSVCVSSTAEEEEFKIYKVSRWGGV